MDPPRLFVPVPELREPPGFETYDVPSLPRKIGLKKTQLEEKVKRIRSIGSKLLLSDIELECRDSNGNIVPELPAVTEMKKTSWTPNDLEEWIARVRNTSGMNFSVVGWSLKSLDPKKGAEEIVRECGEALSLVVWPGSLGSSHRNYHLLTPDAAAAMDELVDGPWEIVNLESRIPNYKNLYLALPPGRTDAVLPTSFTNLRGVRDLSLKITPTEGQSQFLPSSFFPAEMANMKDLSGVVLHIMGPEVEGVGVEEENEEGYADTAPDGDSQDRTFPNITSVLIKIWDPERTNNIVFIDNMLRYVLKCFPSVEWLQLSSNTDFVSGDPRQLPPSPIATRLLEMMQRESIMGPKTRESQTITRSLSKLKNIVFRGGCLNESHLETLLCDIIVPNKMWWYPNIEMVDFYGNGRKVAPSNNNRIADLTRIATRLARLTNIDKTNGGRDSTENNYILRKLFFHGVEQNPEQVAAVLDIVKILGLESSSFCDGYFVVPPYGIDPRTTDDPENSGWIPNDLKREIAKNKDNWLNKSKTDALLKRIKKFEDKTLNLFEVFEKKFGHGTPLYFWACCKVHSFRSHPCEMDPPEATAMQNVLRKTMRFFACCKMLTTHSRSCGNGPDMDPYEATVLYNVLRKTVCCRQSLLDGEEE